jgi:hypothetical protein
MKEVLTCSLEHLCYQGYDKVTATRVPNSLSFRALSKNLDIKYIKLLV